MNQETRKSGKFTSRQSLPAASLYGLASSRRGGSRRFHCRSSLLSAHDLLHHCVEARIAAEIIEQWIYFDERNVESSVVVAMLQFVDGVRLIAQCCQNYRESIGRDVLRFCLFPQAGENLLRLVRFSLASIRLAQHGERERIVI